MRFHQIIPLTNHQTSSKPIFYFHKNVIKFNKFKHKVQIPQNTVKNKTAVLTNNSKFIGFCDDLCFSG